MIKVKQHFTLEVVPKLKSAISPFLAFFQNLQQKKSSLEVSPSISPIKCTTSLREELKEKSEKTILSTFLVDQNPPTPQSDKTNATLSHTLLPKDMTKLTEVDSPTPQGTSTTPLPSTLPCIGSLPPKTPSLLPNQNNTYCMKIPMLASDSPNDSHLTVLPHATNHVTPLSFLCNFNTTLGSSFGIGPASKTEGTINRKRISIKEKARTSNGKKFKSESSTAETVVGSKEKATETEYFYPNAP